MGDRARMNQRGDQGIPSLLRAVLLIALMIGNIAAAPFQQPPPNGRCRYFSNTGHYVCDEFLDFYNTRGGLAIFGYPLTEAFNDPDRGLWVQYFQRARMELHPGNSAAYRVQLGLLADELGYIYPPVDESQIPAFNSSLHHYFAETKHIVSYAFLQFYKEKGGLDIFGYPRSEFMYEDGYVVQYFQRARMEWHPQETAGSQMRLMNIGERYLERFDVPKGVKDPLPPRIEDIRSGTPTPTPGPIVTRLEANASVRYAIVGREGTQTVFVYVNNQSRAPVSNATVITVVHYPSRSIRHACESPTNKSGFCKCTFPIETSPPGKKVLVDVIVTFDGRDTTTQTFFLPWW